MAERNACMSNAAGLHEESAVRNLHFNLESVRGRIDARIDSRDRAQDRFRQAGRNNLHALAIVNVVGMHVGDRQTQLQCLIDHQTKDFIPRMHITAGSHGPVRDRIGCTGKGSRIGGRWRFDHGLGQALPGDRQRLLLDLGSLLARVLRADFPGRNATVDTRAISASTPSPLPDGAIDNTPARRRTRPIQR